MKIAQILRPAPPLLPTSINDCLTNIKETWQKNFCLINLLEDWENIVGPQLVHHCQPIYFNKQTLIIGAQEPDWLQALIYNRKRLVESLRRRGFEIKELQIQQCYVEKVISKPMNSNLQSWECHPHRADIHGISVCPVCNCSASIGEMARWGHCSLCQRHNF